MGELGPRRSEWLAGAAEAAAVETNGREPVGAAGLAVRCLRRLGCEWWMFETLYAPLRVLRRYRFRVEKYFWATVASVEMLEAAFGRGVPETRHLHRHAVVTCYLDALVDSSGDLAWALAFGLAVFGVAGAPPAFTGGQDEEMRGALRHDYPRLRLACAGPCRELIRDSLLQAAAVESRKREVVHREHKLLSNLVCVRPFLLASGAVDPALMEPLAMVYTFFDDALDVLEDLAAGEETHMGSEAGVARSAGLVRRAMSEINARCEAGDWSAIGEVAVRAATGAALAQIREPGLYRGMEAGVCGLCAPLVAVFFLVYVSARGAG